MASAEKRALAQTAEVKRLLPNVATVACDRYGIEFVKDSARCPFPQNHTHGDRDPSLRYDKKKNRLFCASQHCFGHKGVDAIGLVQWMDRCSFPEALARLVDHYGLQVGNDTQKSTQSDDEPRASSSLERRTPKEPIRADKVRHGLLRDGFQVVTEFEYGRCLRKVRFEHSSARQTEKDRPRKVFRWEHLVGGVWCSGDGNIPKPLYVNSAFREGDQVGLAVGFEGEAKADLAGEFGLAAFSFKDIGLEQAAGLADCDVVLWPDNDASGKQQAASAAAVISSARSARSIKCLTPPAELIVGGDIVDAISSLKWDRACIGQFLETATPVEKEPARRETGSLTTRRLSEVEAKPVHWLWPGRIARGKLTILAGNPGLGKSQITASIAAIVTGGGCWPVDRQVSERSDVLFLSAEDDPADTLRPRLEAAGADLRRIHFVEGVAIGYSGDGTRQDRAFSLQADLQVLGEKLAELGNVAVVVIDPITAYLGDTDSHKNAEVRSLLAPLSDVAARYDVAIIGVSHLNKGVGAQALMRVTGSLAFVAAARAAYVVTTDPQVKSRRLMLPLKNNLGPDTTGLAFSIEGATVTSPTGALATSRVVWESEPVSITADEAMEPDPRRQPSAQDQAGHWLTEALSAGPLTAEAIFNQAKAEGIAEKTLRRASKVIGIRKTKPGMKEGWMWSLPTKMAKPAEDAPVSDLVSFEGIGHLQEISDLQARPKNHICAECEVDDWQLDGTVWVCGQCHRPAPGSAASRTSAVDFTRSVERPMSPAEVRE